MSGQVIFLSAVLGAGAMSMRGEAVLLGSYLLRFAHDPDRCTYSTVSRAGQAEALRAPQTRRTGKFRIASAVFAFRAEAAPAICAFRFWAIPCKRP